MKQMTDRQKHLVKRKRIEMSRTNKGKGRPHGNLTQIDRIRAHYADGDELEPADEERRQRCEQISGMMVEGQTRQQVVTTICKQWGITKAKAYSLVRDSVEIFGDLNKGQKQGMRGIIAEQYLLLAQAARDKKELETWKKALDSYSRLMGLDAADEKAEVSRKPVILFYSQDPAALQEPETEIDPEEA